MEGEDYYAALGIEGGGPEVTPFDVRKGFRTLALIWHPDKQAGKKPVDVAAAAARFDKIQKAHEVLGDEKARKAYDELRNLQKSRLEKEEKLSFKRQKMMKDLRMQEQAFKTERAAKREEDLAAKRLQAEISRIRATHLKMRTNPEGLDFSFLSQSSAKSTSGPSPAQAVEMQSTLKVSWSCTDGGAGGYTATTLKEIFEEFGAVEDVVIRESKSRKKGSALVVMTSKDAAMSATDAPCGELSNPLRVVPVLSTPNTRPEPVVSSKAAPVNVDGLVNVVGSGYQSFENDVLTKMRQAAERARIIKEMKEQDLKTS